MTIRGKWLKNKNVLLITVFSLIACMAHGAMLYTPFNTYVHTSAAKVVLFMLVPFMYFKISKDGKFTGLFTIKGDNKSIKQSIILGIIAFVFIIIAFPVVRPWLDSYMIIETMSNVGITADNYIFVAMYYVFVNVALEELFFRGFVFLTLYRMNYKIYAHVYSSLLFSVYHIAIISGGITTGLLLLSVIGLIIVGLMFNEISRRCQNVVGSIIIHASASLAIGLIGFYFLYY